MPSGAGLDVREGAAVTIHEADGPLGVLRRYPLTSVFVLAYALTWALWGNGAVTGVLRGSDVW